MDEMLVIVVDGSLNLSSHWDNVKTILESIIRRFCTNEASTSAPSIKKYNLGLIINAVLYNFAAQSDGTIGLDSFLYSLSNLNLDKYSPLGNSGASEGLSKALMLFQSTKNIQQTHLSWKRHCVLVTACHPCLDAKKLACSFIESCVSLSVICPKDKSTVNKTIDDAGNIVQYPLTIALKHPRILLFISDQFPEAREALEKLATENNIIADLEQGPPNSYYMFLDEELRLLDNFLSQQQMEQQNEDENMPIIADDVISGSTQNTNIIDETLPLEPISHVHDDEEHRLLENIFSQPQMGQQNEDENMPIIEGNMMSGVFPCGSTQNANIIDETLPLEPISHTHDVLGDNHIMQQGMQTEYLQDELHVAGGSVQITPEEMEVFNTLISRDICPFQLSYLNFLTSSNDFNMNEQIVMADLLSSPVHIPEGTPISSANHPSQSTIPEPNNIFHISTSWLLENNPEKILKSSNSNMLTLRSDNVPMSSSLTTSNSTSGTKSVFSTNMQGPSINSSNGNKMVLGEKNRIASMSYLTTKHVISTKDTHRANINNDSMKELLSTKAPLSRTNNIVTSSVTNVSSSRTSCHLKLSEISASPLLSSCRILTKKFSSDVVSGYIKAWEGSIASRGSGVTIFVSKLVAYKKNTIPEKIFKNWPKMMQLDHLVHCTQAHSSPTQANKIPLVFKVIDPCPVWDHMKEKNLCGYVALPGQMLKLWISEDNYILMGTLFEKTDSKHQ